MNTTRFLGLLCVSSAMFALPAAAQTPDGITPAKEEVCNVLTGATPGLYGLCVAFCEAQDCEATLDPATGIVTLDPSCSPSSASLLENYYKKAGDSDPQLPCLKVPCPCWSEPEMDNIAGYEVEVDGQRQTYDHCFSKPTMTGIYGTARDRSGAELAYAIESPQSCIMIETNPPTFRSQSINTEEFQTCKKSILNECTLRKVPLE